MIRLARFASAFLALALVGCASVTTSQYRVSKATGHRERVETLLARFAAREHLSAVQIQRPSDAGNESGPFAFYRDLFSPGIALEAFTLSDQIETRLTENRSLLPQPSQRFDTLEQKLLHEFNSAFGSEVRFRTEAGRIGQ